MQQSVEGRKRKETITIYRTQAEQQSTTGTVSFWHVWIFTKVLKRRQMTVVAVITLWSARTVASAPRNHCWLLHLDKTWQATVSLMSMVYLRTKDPVSFHRGIFHRFGRLYLAHCWLGCRQRPTSRLRDRSGYDVWPCVMGPSYRWSREPRGRQAKTHKDIDVQCTWRDQASEWQWLPRHEA